VKHFLWQFQNLNVPMMENGSDTLYTTTQVLAGVLGVTANNLVALYHLHKDEFDDARVNTLHANEFLQQHKEQFGVRRVRQDMHLWTEDDMILFAALSRSDQGKAFRKAMKELVKQQARKTLITKEYFDNVVSPLVQQNQALQARVDTIEEAQPHLKHIAKTAGQMLYDQRFTKPFRS
jgi:prophage antirepressor-like protein